MPESQTPGILWRKNQNSIVAYWTCRQDISKAGYPLKTQRLWSGKSKADADMGFIGDRCKQLQHEMLDWRWRPSVIKRLRVSQQGGFIYFIESGGMIKIGFAVKPERRLSHLQVGSPNPLKMLAVIPGSPRLEKQLHHRFSGLRQAGEWFQPGPNLLAFIDDVAFAKNSGT